MFGTSDASTVTEMWLDSLEAGRSSEAILLGVPSDTGGGAVRGAAFGPIGVREALYASGPIDGFDLGDTFVLPHLLHDDLLNEATLTAAHEAVHGPTDLRLPVSPLSVAEYVAQRLGSMPNPAALFTIGGDHSVSGAVLPHLVASSVEDIALVVIDGHTDLEKSRYGLPLTYSSWVKYADTKVHLPAIVQIGSPDVPGVVRPSERLLLIGLDVAQDPVLVGDLVADWLAGLGVASIYLSIDIDATTHSQAPATGLPAPEGIDREVVLDLIARLGDRHSLRGGDVMEVAPPLSGSVAWQDEATCVTGAMYLRAMMATR
ncbi:Proclavaminate amidinohydrolase [Microbacterium foliorum]|uniref:Proclavaminate amidinohydrolase n=2 Tax=Microbacterium foliorum TaxID=104336 RepID=A0A0F0KUE1_9MICO|nr:Proclavaminate amidinohydrolase [Microbacterium foliorum]